MGYDQNIRRCLGGCEYAQWVDGRHVCAASPERTEPRILAERGLCPAGRFKWEGAGDFAAWAIHRLNLNLAAQSWTRLVRGGKPCSCAKRQEALNGRWAPFWVWLVEWRELVRF